ncbi:uncharacterized protein FMAN_08381 [Fusarium mangiferae]|uniref:Uncharacterized protein n=1 Tax=Fusarium mangiferae TaxID=192010 RepID=A0A1L7TJN6_FUSMA|nr:uncharacterized protein FMAN_08381 [Fusarium mangiferae]CVK98898.1 uncharacterized protein FMAN_08381 [Fusarium mangiferae]
MLIGLVLALAISQAHCLVAKAVQANTSSKTTTPLFVKDGNEFKPYDPFDFKDWAPEPSFYKGLHMIEKTIEVDGQKLTYQDFNMSSLSLEDFKTHVMNTEDFLDASGKFLPSNEEVKAYQYVPILRSFCYSRTYGDNQISRKSLIANEEDPNAKLVLPKSLNKRACVYDGDRCSAQCTNLISRGIRQSLNTNVYGAYHYVSGSLCGTGSISKSVSVTHPSGVSIGAYGTIPGFGKGWVKTVSTFFSTFGIFPTKGADSVTTNISYSGTCGPFNVCFLWERPHFSVDKGVIVTQFIDVATRRACRKPQVTPYEAHVMHSERDPGGATSNGICYSMGNHGCGSRVDASNTLQRCPNNY